MHLRSALRVSSIALMLVALAGCGDDDPTGSSDDALTIEDFVGSWTGTSLVFTNNANPSESVDVIAEGAAAVRFTVLTGGGTRTWVDAGADSDEWDALVSISGNTMTSVPAESSRPTRTYTFTFVGGVLTLTDTNSEFDFTDTDATPVSATEVATFVRN